MNMHMLNSHFQIYNKLRTLDTFTLRTPVAIYLKP
jgi:hypothetical protein